MRPLAGCVLLAAKCCAAANPVLAQPIPPQPPAGQIPAPPPLPGPAAGVSVYDLEQLPAIQGIVSHDTLTPRGDADWLILSNGTEVRVPPHLSSQLVCAVKSGDAITVRGLKALGVPLVAAVSITNDASGQSVIDRGLGFGPRPKGPRETGQPMSVQGPIQTTLHGPRGEVNDAMLEDGMILRLPPPEAERLASRLAPGQTVVAQGDGFVTPVGRVVELHAIGASQAQLNWLQTPGPPPDRRSPRPETFASY